MFGRLLQLVVALPLFVSAEGVGDRLAAVVQSQTDETTRPARLERQRELNAWFHEHDRHLPSEAACTNATDRRNTSEFAAAMSNFQFLALPKRQRERASIALTAYARAVAEHGDAVIRALFPASAESVLTRWQQPPTIKAVCLEGIVTYAPAAVYVPGSATMYLDFNQATDPAVFADAFEHELWHHLVPSVQPPEVAGNLFWEGFNEALSELWSAELRRQAGLALGDGPVRYPVAAALASLCLAADREGTLAWLLGKRSQADFAAGLGRLPTLAASFRDYPRLTADRQQRIATLLADWNWREDDGSPPKLAPFLAGDSIAAGQIRTAFQLNRGYLDAFIDALAVVWLQDAMAEQGRESLLALAKSLPAPLHANVERTINYLRRPDFPLR